MKKCFFVGLLISIVPVMCLGESVRFTQLVREKQRKMAELEKCMGSTKGLKIAGISTLGLSAVGVAANVVEAQKIKEYETKKTAAEKDIEKFNKEIAEIEKCENEGKQYKDGKCVEPSSNEKSDDNEKVAIHVMAFDFAADNDNYCKIFNYYMDKTTDQSTERTCSGLVKGEWKMEMFDSYLTWKGTTKCSASTQDEEFSETPGKYCWGKITHGDTDVAEYELDTWYFDGEMTDEQDCLKNCTSGLVKTIESNFINKNNQ